MTFPCLRVALELRVGRLNPVNKSPVVYGIPCSSPRHLRFMGVSVFDLPVP